MTSCAGLGRLLGSCPGCRSRPTLARGALRILRAAARAPRRALRASFSASARSLRSDSALRLRLEADVMASILFASCGARCLFHGEESGSRHNWGHLIRRRMSGAAGAYRVGARLCESPGFLAKLPLGAKEAPQLADELPEIGLVRHADLVESLEGDSLADA